MGEEGEIEVNRVWGGALRLLGCEHCHDILAANRGERSGGEVGVRVAGLALAMWLHCDYNRCIRDYRRRTLMTTKAPVTTADTYVRARIDTATKDRATDALDAMGLSISDAIRLLMLRIADERRLPFEV